MTEVPKIVHHRLRAAEVRAAEARPADTRSTKARFAEERAGMAHPEADVLAAFAESSLSQEERESVLSHLALCGDCRETLMLALPPTEATAAPSERAAEAEHIPAPLRLRRNWFSWGGLRWAALAAGIAVAILVVRPGMEHWLKPNATADTAKISASPTASPAVAAQISQAPPAVAPSADTAFKTSSRQEQSESLRAKQVEQASSPKRAPVQQPVMRTLAANHIKKESSGTQALAYEADRAAAKQNRPGSVTESVEVSNSETLVATLPSENLPVARGEAPIVKAKPAPQDSDDGKDAQKLAMSGRQVTSLAKNSAVIAEALPTSSLRQRAVWTITSGVLQRSFDGGSHWQTSAHADHALLCYANREQDVWAGGQAGTLLHSVDNGATWNIVQVSFHGRQLTSDIAHIEMHDKGEIELTTSNQETWSSADGGKTWAKN